MRKGHAWVVFVAFAFALLAPSLARAAYAPPPIRGHVTDAAGKLSAAEISALDGKLADYRKCSTNHVAVFVAASLEGSTVEDVAYATFNTWHVGDQKDNGVLLVIAPSERKVRIETGKGIGDRLTDLESKEILREKVSPRLKEDKFFAAIDDGTSAIGQKLGGCAMSSAASRLPATPQDRAAPSDTPSAPIDIPPPRAGVPLWLRIGTTLLMGVLLMGAAAAFGKPSLFWVMWGSIAFAIGSMLYVDLGRSGIDERARFLGLSAVVGGLLALFAAVAWIYRWRKPKRDPIFDEPGGRYPSTSPIGYSSNDSSSSFSSSSSFGSSSSSDSGYSGGSGSSGGGGASDSY